MMCCRSVAQCCTNVGLRDSQPLFIRYLSIFFTIDFTIKKTLPGFNPTGKRERNTPRGVLREGLCTY